MEENRITVNQAAEIMGVTNTFLREALMQDKFPFGAGIRQEGSDKRIFYINKVRFEKWMEGKDMEVEHVYD